MADDDPLLQRAAEFGVPHDPALDPSSYDLTKPEPAPPLHYWEDNYTRAAPVTAPIEKQLAETAVGTARAPFDTGQLVGHGLHDLATQDYDPAIWGQLALAAVPVPGMPKGAKGPARNLDKLGYYSKLDEVLAGFRPTDMVTQDTLAKRGVKASEMEARGLLPLFGQQERGGIGDNGGPALVPQGTARVSDLLDRANKRRVGLLENVYGGDDVNPDLRELNHEVTDSGEHVYDIEDRDSGHTFVITHDPDAGNVYVQGPKGNFIDVPGRTNNQDLEDGFDAIRAYLEKSGVPNNAVGPAKWARWSLDPSNPSYRETVLHLPYVSARGVRPTETAAAPFMEDWNRLNSEIRALNAKRDERIYLGYQPDPAMEQQFKDLSFERESLHNKMVDATIAEGGGGMPGTPGAEPVRMGHFSEPNTVAHARTQILRDAQGNPIYNIDELQADWAQRLREGGIRDEGKIADLRARLKDAHEAVQVAGDENERFARQVSLATGGDGSIGGSGTGAYSDLAHIYRITKPGTQLPGIGSPVEEAYKRMNFYNKALENEKLLAAELRTAESSTPGHPLVNTTDQWTATALRRLLMQADQAGAHGISITPGAEQLSRYPNLSHVAAALRYDPETGKLQFQRTGNYHPTHSHWETFNHEGQERFEPSELSGIIGQEATQRLLAQPRQYAGINHSVTGPHTLGAADMRFEVGGQGMKYAYDQMYPRILEKELRKLDPNYPGRTTIPLYRREEWPHYREGTGPTSRDKTVGMPMSVSAMPAREDFHYFPLTPAVREQIRQGLPMFHRGGMAGYASGGAVRHRDQGGDATEDEQDPVLARAQEFGVPHNPILDPRNYDLAKDVPDQALPQHYIENPHWSDEYLQPAYEGAAKTIYGTARAPYDAGTQVGDWLEHTAQQRWGTAALDTAAVLSQFLGTPGVRNLGIKKGWGSLEALREAQAHPDWLNWSSLTPEARNALWGQYGWAPPWAFGSGPRPASKPFTYHNLAPDLGLDDRFMDRIRNEPDQPASLRGTLGTGLSGAEDLFKAIPRMRDLGLIAKYDPKAPALGGGTHLKRVGNQGNILPTGVTMDIPAGVSDYIPHLTQHEIAHVLGNYWGLPARDAIAMRGVAQNALGTSPIPGTLAERAMRDKAAELARMYAAESDPEEKNLLRAAMTAAEGRVRGTPAFAGYMALPGERAAREAAVRSHFSGPEQQEAIAPGLVYTYGKNDHVPEELFLKNIGSPPSWFDPDTVRDWHRTGGRYGPPTYQYDLPLSGVHVPDPMPPPPGGWWFNRMFRRASGGRAHRDVGGGTQLAMNDNAGQYGDDVVWLRKGDVTRPVPYSRPTPPAWEGGQYRRDDGTPSEPERWQSPRELMEQGWEHYPAPLPPDVSTEQMHEWLADPKSTRHGYAEGGDVVEKRVAMNTTNTHPSFLWTHPEDPNSSEKTFPEFYYHQKAVQDPDYVMDPAELRDYITTEYPRISPEDLQFEINRYNDAVKRRSGQ